MQVLEGVMEKIGGLENSQPSRSKGPRGRMSYLIYIHQKFAITSLICGASQLQRLNLRVSLEQRFEIKKFCVDVPN